MQESSTTVATILQFRQELERQLRDQIRQAVEVILDEELAAVLGSGHHERTEARRGYRHGTIERRLTTADGFWNSPPPVPRRLVQASKVNTMAYSPSRQRGSRTSR